MFRRGSRDGSVQSYDVGGIWGGGNVITERAPRLAGEEPTVFTMWDGHAIAGPGRPGGLEKYPALVAVLDLEEFYARYEHLTGERCQVWLGDELRGVNCPAACADLDVRCPNLAPADCERACAAWPRAVGECMAAADSCELMQLCDTSAWQPAQ